MAPWAWAMAAVVFLGLVETLVVASGWGRAVSQQTIAIRWLAVCATFCPAMAQLGAKRPQDRGWQWIVLSLWGILVMPAGESLFLDRPLVVSSARSVFMWVLVGVGLVNMLPTRFGIAATIFAAAQVCLLMPYLAGQYSGSE